MNAKLIKWLVSGGIILVLAIVMLVKSCSSDDFGLCVPFMGAFLIILSVILLLILNLPMGIFARISLILLFVAFLLSKANYNYYSSLILFLVLVTASIIFAIFSMVKEKDSKIYSIISLVIGSIFIVQILLGFSIYSNPPLTSENINFISSNSGKIVLELSLPSKLLYSNRELVDVRCDIGGPTKSGGRFAGQVYNLKSGLNELSIPQDENTYDKLCCWGYWNSVGKDKLCYSI